MCPCPRLKGRIKRNAHWPWPCCAIRRRLKCPWPPSSACPRGGVAGEVPAVAARTPGRRRCDLGGRGAQPGGRVALADTLAAHGPMHLVLGILANKDAQAIVEALAPHALSHTFVPVGDHPHHDPKQLAERFGGRAALSLHEALDGLPAPGRSPARFTLPAKSSPRTERFRTRCASSLTRGRSRRFTDLRSRVGVYPPRRS